MKFVEIALEIKRTLDELADNRSSSIDYLISQSIPYTKHICKIMLWGLQDKDWLKDWSDEIYNYIKNINDIILKGNKRVKSKDYKKYFFFKNLEAKWELETRLQQVAEEFIQRDKYPHPSYINVQNAYSKYEKFVTDMLILMENNNLRYEDVISSCKELLPEV